eukprot:scaffold2645_cov378-Prasinococcus_capsulatus_cf.AAC.1
MPQAARRLAGVAVTPVGSPPSLVLARGEAGLASPPRPPAHASMSAPTRAHEAGAGGMRRVSRAAARRART